MKKKYVIKSAKVGILLVKDGQKEQDEMFGNKENSPAFTEFLNLLGDQVTLTGFVGFRGGLDTKYETTGKTSYYTKFEGLEIMFHVSTLLPHFAFDKQQLEKKRHLGNDVVVIVFNESSQPFYHQIISSQFNQIYPVITPVTVDGNNKYKLDFSIKDGLPPFGPAVPNNILFDRNANFRTLLLTKVLNGERAAYASPVFHPIIKRTLNQLLDELIRKLL